MTAIADELLDRHSPAGPEEPLDAFEIRLAPIGPAEDDRPEPIFLGGPLWFGFEEPEERDPTLEHELPEAPPAGFAEVPQLDPERGAREPDEPQPVPRQRASAASLFGSLGVHLLPLLVLLAWSSAPAELPPTIPVQFVVEETQSAPAEAPPDRLVTETVSETRSNSDNSPATAAPPPPPVKPPPTKTASVKPPPKSSPPPEPMPKQSVKATPPAPIPPAPVQSTPAPPVPIYPAAMPTSPAASPNPAPREARIPGPDPARGDYFDRLVALTRTHLDLLPRAFLSGRRGQTILSIVVLEDGTIGRISLKRSSGYPDIDTRIEQIVAAVGHFPPLPASFQRPSVELDFDLTFPNALQQ